MSKCFMCKIEKSYCELNYIGNIVIDKRVCNICKNKIKTFILENTFKEEKKNASNRNKSKI